MQYQCSQDSSFSGPLSLSLSKFSYATVAEDSNAPIPWIHLSSKGNLFAVFEKCRTWDHQGQLHEKSGFRVTNGAEIMEDLNLIALAAEARNAIGQRQVSNILNRPSAVTIIVKKPCVAVRYPSTQGQIRRFQVRFLHDTDYYTAMGRFSEANAPVTEAGTFPTPQPQPRQFSSSSSVIYPSDSASHLNIQPPSTPPVHPTQKYSSTSTSSILNGAEDFLRPAMSGSSTTEGSPAAYARPQMISNGAYNQQARTDIYALPHETPEPSSVRPQHGATTSLHCNDGNGLLQPPTKQYIHLVDHKQRSSTTWSAPATTLNYPSVNLYEPRPSTAPVIESQGLSEMLPPKRDLPFSKPVPRRESKGSRNRKPISEITLAVLALKENKEIPVQSSQPSDTQELETQSAPPTAKSRRALAKKAPPRIAKKPTAPRSRKKATSLRGASPVPSVQELLTRSQVSAKDVATTSKTIDTQVLLARVEERQAVATCHNPVSKNNLAFHFAQEATTVAQEESSEASLAGPRLTAGEQATEVSLFEERAPGAKIFMAVAGVCGSHEGHQNPLQALSASGQENPPGFSATAPDPPLVCEALLEQPQNIAPQPCEPSAQNPANPLVGPLTSLLQDPDFASSPSLAQWAEDPEEERRLSLESFICRSVRDENFFKLCKDLDGTWQKVFLGKIL